MKENKDVNRKSQLQSVVRYVKTILFAVLMCVCMNYTESRAAEILYSGTSGDLDWSIDSEGLLRISGTGDFNLDGVNSNGNEIPKWAEYQEYIKSAVVDVDGAEVGAGDGAAFVVETDLTVYCGGANLTIVV